MHPPSQFLTRTSKDATMRDILDSSKKMESLRSKGTSPLSPLTQEALALHNKRHPSRSRARKYVACIVCCELTAASGHILSIPIITERLPLSATKTVVPVAHA